MAHCQVAHSSTYIKILEWDHNEMKGILHAAHIRRRSWLM